MTSASKVTVQKLLLSPIKLEESFLKIENTLPSLELKNLKTKISTPPIYMLFRFAALQQKGEIQITLEPRAAKTLLNISWSFSIKEDFEKSILMDYNYKKIEEFRLKMVATVITSTVYIDPVPENSTKNSVDAPQKQEKVRVNSRFFLQFTCPVCGETFPNPKCLRKHRDITHKMKGIEI